MVEDIPPLLGAGVRFLIAGAILYAWVAWRAAGRRAPSPRRQLLGAAIVGLLLMFGGNGLVTVAEQEVPSGPGRAPDRDRPAVGDPAARQLRAASACRRRRSTSVAVGFVGVALLVLPGDRPEDAPLGWSLLRRGGGRPLGQRLVRRQPGRAAARRAHRHGVADDHRRRRDGGRRAGARRGRRRCTWPRSALDSWAAFVFLVFVGSIAAFTAYNWLLRHVALSTVATYAFVNPVIAVFLGWAILSRGDHSVRRRRDRRDRRLGRLRRPEPGGEGTAPPVDPVRYIRITRERRWS